MFLDPLSEQFMGWTPYHYVHQNPINLVDPTGMSAEPPEEGDFNDGDTHTDESGSWTFFNNVWYDNTGNDNNINSTIVIDKSSTDYIGIAKEVASYLPGGGLVDIYDGLKSGNKLQVGIGVVTTVADVMSFGMGGFVIKGGVKALLQAGARETLEYTAKQGFKTFPAFKKVYGSAGKGNAWHHIVEQHSDNIAKFGAEKIHNIDNLIKLPDGKGSIHRKITGYYNSKMPGTNMRYRDYVKTLNYEQQYEFGMDVLKRFGGGK